MKYSFKNDYSEGAHPKILEAILQTNEVQQNGYGEDEYSMRAKKLIKEHLNAEAEVFFVSGGTQANLTFISAVLKPYQSVISAETGHIFHHETGAIEATGHKIETIATLDGKLTPALIAMHLNKVEPVHMTMPALVYISNSTELGTFYSKDELVALWEFCQQRNLWLFMDGARLASGLAAGDLTLADVAKHTDAFYIGGTKNGALLGEAIVINNVLLHQDFVYNMKMRGALLAKGRLLGLQFLVLFQNGLFFELGHHANKMAAQLSGGIKTLGYDFLTDSKTNQIFPVFPNTVIAKLREQYEFYDWLKINEEKTAVRLVTSWFTKLSVVNEFVDDLKLAGV
ncbi:threonine aldolase family protein [Polluticaenibacter yanchengensis]|uniref:Aminotransferase class I/II-fold pyridoxal phosphate-dependent enzyme n=1 Tax=Polluticaenibacter yanchengensis TaxID=3014562 RepID=A0ABT4UK40_9BACT|nr:aminotransferase class I/II-fold pyridoxal phosphate-dependent enzyme [Chitinophagaceae bacterium LY-5]